MTICFLLQLVQWDGYTLIVAWVESWAEQTGQSFQSSKLAADISESPLSSPQLHSSRSASVQHGSPSSQQLTSSR